MSEDHGTANVLAETRRRAIEQRLRSAGAMTVAEVEATFGVSAMTARRDLSELARRGVAERTHGGAILPGGQTHEDSFARRLQESMPEKRQLAEAAVGLLAEKASLFLDSSTTSYFVAESIAEQRLSLTVLTNSLPIVNRLREYGSSWLEVILVGGTLRPLSRSFVGPSAARTVREHFAEHFFFSVKSVTDQGILTDADPLEAEVKRLMMGQAGESTLLIDSSKGSARGLVAIGSIRDVDHVLTVGFSAAQLEALRALNPNVVEAGTG